MEALNGATSVSALQGSARLAALPDPSQPILAVVPQLAGDSGNPFSGEKLTAFHDNPMRALGERLGASAEEDGQPLEASDLVATESAAGGGDDDPFGAASPGEDDPFGGSDNDSDEGSDPFDEEDPFADGGDPFGF